MPPRPKMTKDMIVDAAFELVRKNGADAITAQAVAGVLGCSTQPVMYHFSTIEDLRKAAYEKADGFHSGYLMDIGDAEDPMLEIGLNYIRFSVNEPKLFQFLFQSGYGPHVDLMSMMDSPELEPIMHMMMQAMEMTMDETRKVFASLAIFTHGYASLIANHYMEYDETEAVEFLANAYRGAAAAVEENDDEKDI